MKPFKSLLVVVAIACAMIASVASSSAVYAISYGGTETGNFYVAPDTFFDGQDVKLTGNFPSDQSFTTVTFYHETTPGNYGSIGTDESNKYGNAYLTYTTDGTEKVFAKVGSSGQVTEVRTLSPETVSPVSCTETGNLYVSPDPVPEDQPFQITANFPNAEAFKNVTFFTKVGLNYEPIGVDEANKYGNAYLDHTLSSSATLYAASETGNCTETQNVVPVPSSAVLEPLADDGAKAKAEASFVPISNGAKTELQVKEIDGGAWKTIDTDTQRSDGRTFFSISDPLEVEHEYRALSNGLQTNVVKYAGPFLDKNTGLATVYFNSNDGESVNTRTKYFEGEFAMKAGANFPDCGDEGVFKGPTKAEKAEMKGRGNYSWSFPKKSFSLKLDDKNNLCGLGSSSKWALVANDYDRSLIRNPVASWVGTQFDNLGWTPQQRPVDLYVNGSYRGSYTLVERINFEGGRLDYDELKAEDDPTDCSDPVKRTGSYLMEWDFRKGANYNFTAGSRGYVGLKEPEDEDYCSAMGTYINGYVDAADKALFGSNFKDDANGWKKYIDIDSAVDYYLAMEFLKPVDGNMWASVYMYKPRGDKIHLGPLWDFDLAEGSANRAGNVVSPQSWYLRNSLGVSAMQSSKTWFNRLNEDPDFRAAVIKRWNEVDQDLHPSTFIALYRNQIAKSADENYKKWSHGSHISKYQVIKSSWGADVEYVRSWLESRNSWMNSQLDNDD